jgi:transcriptional regulator with XRE-family HTH domain
MVIGSRIRQLREEKGLSQGDIEERTGLLRCYVSRVENGHTVPSLETLERFAAALDVQLYELFYAGEESAVTPNLSERKTVEEIAADEKKESEMRFFVKLKGILSRVADSDREVLLGLAKMLASRS